MTSLTTDTDGKASLRKVVNVRHYWAKPLLSKNHVIVGCSHDPVCATDDKETKIIHLDTTLIKTHTFTEKHSYLYLCARTVGAHARLFLHAMICTNATQFEHSRIQHYCLEGWMLRDAFIVFETSDGQVIVFAAWSFFFHHGEVKVALCTSARLYESSTGNVSLSAPPTNSRALQSCKFFFWIFRFEIIWY